jgi:hypothetical protein
MMLVRQNDPQLRLSNLKEVISGLQPAEFARWQVGRMTDAQGRVSNA